MNENEYVITVEHKASDEPYLSAIFKDDKLMGILQNERVSEIINVEHVASFLVAIASSERYYPEALKLDGEKYIRENTTVIPAIDIIGDNFIEMDF